MGKVVVIPVAYNDHLYLRYANKNINLSSQTHLFNYQDSSGKKYIEVVGNATGTGFASADVLWTDIQTQMINFINRNGGHAKFYNQKHYIARPNWDAVNDYLNGIIDLTTLKHRLGC